METASTSGSWFARLTGRDTAGNAEPLYAAVVAEARAKDWYSQCRVPDTIDGRFDMVVLVLALVLLRLEREGEPHWAVRLTEAFVRDMDGQVREIGFGDLVVGKQVGGMVSALGGRLSTYREGLSDEALVRNVWRGQATDAASVTALRVAAERLRERIDAVPLSALLTGRL